MADEETKVSSSAEAFAHCQVDHHNLVNNEAAYPDVVFQVDDKNSLSAHYYVLKMRLPQVLEEAAMSKKKDKSGKKGKNDAKIVIKVKKTDMISPGAMERVLVWAYCGAIDFSDYTPFKAIEVMRACSVYKIPRLMQMNERYLQDNLTMKNIFSLIKFADSLSVQEAKDICIEFALVNEDFFTSSSAENLGFKLYQEVTALLLKHHQGGGNKKMVLREITAEDTIIGDFKNLYGSADVTGDVSFVIQNEEIKAHRAILCLQSADIGQLVKPPAEEGKEPVKKGIVLDNKYQRISPGAFMAMLRFFYYGDTKIAMIHATELVSFVKDYHLDKLYRVLEKVIGGQEVTKETVLNVLDVAYHPLMDENPQLQKSLKEEGLNFAVQHIDQINFEPLMIMPPVIATHILQSLQAKIGKNWMLVLDAAQGGGNVKVDELRGAPNAAAPKSPRKAPVAANNDHLVKSASKTHVSKEDQKSARSERSEKKEDDKEKKTEKSERRSGTERSKSRHHDKEKVDKRESKDKLDTPKK